MQGRTDTVVEGCPVYRYTLGGGSIMVAFGSGITKEYSASKRYCFSRADLFSLATALASGK